jgi:hypothetical protein
MFKYLILFVILLLIILPANAIDTCPTCPVPTPHIVYVTVTVTIPVPQTLPPTPIPTPIPIPTQESNVITKFTGIPEYGIYGLLFLLLAGGVIFMKIKQRKKDKPKKIEIQPEISSDKYGNLYEEDEPQQIEPPKPIIKEKEPKKPKKPKKSVSLLDRDFEF